MEDSRVAVLLEDLRSQFRTFGEGLQLLNEKLDAHIEENRREFEINQQKFDSIRDGFERNHQEHSQLIQMIRELDKEVQVEIKRVK